MFNLKPKDVNKVVDDLLYNFGDLPTNKVKSDLLALTEYMEVYPDIARIIAENYSNLDKEIIEILILTIIKNEDTALEILRIIKDNYNDIISSIKVKSLIKLSHIKKEIIGGGIIEIIKDHYSEILLEIRYFLLYKLTENEFAIPILLELFRKRYNNIDIRFREELLLKLSTFKFADIDLGKFLEANYDRIEEGLRKKLLQNLSKFKNSSWNVSNILIERFTEFNEDFRENLLLNLSNMDKAIENILRILEDLDKEINPNIFKDALTNVSQVLLEESEEINSGKVLCRFLLKNFDIIPVSIRNRILTDLSKKRGFLEDLSLIFEKHFDSIPDNLKSILIYIISQDEASNERISDLLSKKIILDNLKSDFYSLKYILPKNKQPEHLFELLEVDPISLVKEIRSIRDSIIKKVALNNLRTRTRDLILRSSNSRLISDLFNEGLFNSKIKRFIDFLRLMGNEAVHIEDKPFSFSKQDGITLLSVLLQFIQELKKNDLIEDK